MNKNKSKSLIAISFKMEIKEGVLQEVIGIPEYLEDLYKEDMILEWPIIPEGKKIKLTLAHLHRAR
jgi:hypothetical protein